MLRQSQIWRRSCLLERLFPHDESLRAVTAEITKTCHEFSDIDSRSDGYRYPIDSKGHCSTKKHQVINLGSFAEHMSSVLEKLDIVHGGLYIETDLAQETYKAVEDLLSSLSDREQL